MKIFKPLLFLTISFFILTSIASATTFSDNFNTGFGSGWSNDGNWGVGSSPLPTLDGTQFVMSAPGTSQSFFLNRTGYTNSTIFMMSFLIEAAGSGSGQYLDIRFDENGTSRNSLRVYKVGSSSSVVATIFENGYWRGSYSNISLSANTWYNLLLTKDYTTNTVTYTISRSSDLSSMGSGTGVMPNFMTSSQKFVFNTQGCLQCGYIKVDNYYTETEIPTYGISFDSSEYGINDVATTTYNIEPSFWNVFYFYNLVYLNNDTNYVAFRYDNIPISGTYSIQPTSRANIRAEIRRTILGFSPVVLYQAYASVGSYDSYIFINQTVPVGFLQNVQYRWGFKPSQSNLQKWIIEKYFNPQTSTYEKGLVYPAIGNSINTLYTTQILFPKEGKYLVELTESGHGVVASTTIDTVVQGGIPTHNLQNSNITILNKRSQYAAGEYIQYKYAVDSNNFSNRQVDIEYYNYQLNYTQHLEYVQSDLGESNYYIVGNIKGTVPFILYGGNAALRLRGTNDTGTITLAYDNFTFSEVDSEGYGLKFPKYNGCKNEKITFTAIVPGDAKVVITSTTSTTYNISTTRDISFILKDDTTITLSYGDSQKKLAIVQMDSCVAPITTTPPKSQADITTDLLGNGFYISVMILLLFSGIGFVIGTALGAVVGFGAGFIFLSVYGFIPLYALFLFAIIAIIVLAIIISKGVVGGGSD